MSMAMHNELRALEARVAALEAQAKPDKRVGEVLASLVNGKTQSQATLGLKKAS